VLTDTRRRWQAHVLADGSVDYPGGQGSIHRAGAAVQDAPSCNGWMFWHVEEAGGLVPLDALRQKYILTMER
jgi:modification methylase